MADLVSRMLPKAKARVTRDVGAFKVRLPVDLLNKGKTGYVDIGINLISSPFEDFEDNPLASFRVRESVKKALTDTIQVQYGNGSSAVEEVSFVDLLADVIIEKSRNTL